MKTYVRRSALTCALGVVAAAAGATEYNLGDLIGANSSIAFGDKVFGDFAFAGSGFQAGHVTVTPSMDADGTYFLQFQGPWTAVQGQVADLSLSYSVSVVDPARTITWIDQAMVLSVGGTGGFILIGETVRSGSFAGPAVAQSSLSFIPSVPPAADLEDPAAEPWTGDNLSVPDLTKLWVTKDIFFGANADGLIGPTTIVQSFHQSTPDGGTTLLLIGMGLAGLGLWRRRVAV